MKFKFLTLILTSLFLSFGLWASSNEPNLDVQSPEQKSYHTPTTIQWVDPQAITSEKHKEIKEMFITSFLDAYRDFTPDDLKIEFPTKEAWLTATFEEEQDDLKGQKTPIKLLTVIDGAKVVGAATVEGAQNKIGALYIRQLALLPEYRHKGVGTGMIHQIEEDTGGFNNISSIVVMVRVVNKGGRNFYNKLKYEEGTYKHPGYSSETYIGYSKALKKRIE